MTEMRVRRMTRPADDLRYEVVSICSVRIDGEMEMVMMGDDSQETGLITQ